MLIYSNATGTLHHVEAAFGAYLHLKWFSGPRLDAPVREIFDHILAHMQQTGCWQVLVDQQHMEPASVETQYWFRHIWLPRIAAVITRGCAAIIVGQDVFTYLATVSLMRDTDQTVEAYPYLSYRLFPREVEALGWLTAQATN